LSEATSPEAIARRRQLAEVEQAREQAQLAGEKFEKIRQAQMAAHGELPQVPKGRPPEAVPHRAIPVERLEKKPKPQVGQVAGVREFFQKRYGGKPKQRERVRIVRVRQGRGVRSSRGAPVYNKRNPLESSGRISNELNPVRAQRLVHLREQIRAFQNRREIGALEKIWRKTRARYSHDPELRP